MDVMLFLSLLASIGVLAVIWRVERLLAEQNGRLTVRIATLEHGGHSAGRQGDSDGGAQQHIRRGVGDPISTSGNAPRLGYPAPQFDLADRSGSRVSAADFPGTKVFVLFWSPGCAFCKQIMEDVRSWEDTDDVNALKLLIVSSGPELLHAGMDLRSPVLLDTNSATMRAYGAIGTPSAVVIDAHGNIASTLARGGPAVLALLRRAPHIQSKRISAEMTPEAISA
jgi:peroxiredoxin